MSAPLIRHLFISPGHNFFGHHGGPAGNHPIVEVERVECHAGRGLVGDRFYNYKPDYKGQLTLFSWEIFQQLRRELPAPHAQPSALRRNIVTEHLDLDALRGQRFVLQGIKLEGAEESRPCYWMDEAIGPGANDWLKGRGGLRCRILSNGWLQRTAGQ